MIGIDLVYIPRLKKTIAMFPQFIRHVYTPQELDISQNIYFLATRFCAKEAIMKATNLKYDFKDIEILKDQDGKPVARIIGNNSLVINLSLSYDGEYAIAYVLINQKK